MKIPLQGYIYRIAKNKWLDHLRSHIIKKQSTIKRFCREYFYRDELLSEEEVKYISEVKKKFKDLGENCR